MSKGEEVHEQRKGEGEAKDLPILLQERRWGGMGWGSMEGGRGGTGGGRGGEGEKEYEEGRREVRYWGREWGREEGRGTAV